MKEKFIIEKSTSRTNWKRLKTMRNKDIDYRDNPPTNAEFWKDAKVVANPKTHLSIRLDSDIVRYFKKSGPGYQSRINAVLRAFVRSQKDELRDK